MPPNCKTHNILGSAMKLRAIQQGMLVHKQQITPMKDRRLELWDWAEKAFRQHR